jgi:hypothetical protein
MWKSPRTMTLPLALSSETVSPFNDVKVNEGAFSPTLKKLLADTAVTSANATNEIAQLIRSRFIVTSPSKDALCILARAFFDEQ